MSTSSAPLFDQIELIRTGEIFQVVLYGFLVIFLPGISKLISPLSKSTIGQRSDRIASLRRPVARLIRIKRGM